MKNIGRYPIKSAEEIKKLFEQQNKEDQFAFDTMDAYRDNLDEEKLQAVLKRIKDKYDLDCEKSNNQIINEIMLHGKNF